MTSSARTKANQQNARASTGPRSWAGKARASLNARRHGLGIPIRSDPGHAPKIDFLARSLAGPDASAEILCHAHGVAEAHIEVERVRERHQQILERYDQRVSELGPKPLTETSISMLSDLISELRVLDRYQERALSRRNRAAVSFDTVRLLAASAVPIQS